MQKEKEEQKGIQVYFIDNNRFKNTEIGEIPKEWEVKRIKDILKFTNSVNGIKEKEIHEKGKYPVINQGKEFIAGFSDEEKFLIKEELPIIVFGDHTCEVKYVHFPFIVAGEGVKLLKPIDSLNELYFFYALENFKPKPQHYRRHFRILKDMFIPLPPLSEQKAIAKVLKDFDDLLEVIEDKIKTLQRIKKVLMEVYFTRGVFEHKEFKDTEIGRIPKDWDVKRLGGEICEINPNYKIQRRKVYKFLPMEAVSEEFYKVKFYTEREWNGSGVKFSFGDVLLARITPSAENGKTAIIDFLNKDEYGIGSTEFIVFKPKEADSFFIYYILKWDKVRSLLINQMTGTTGRQRIPSSAPNRIKIPLPPLEEQKAISHRLKTIDDQIENLKSQKEHIARSKKKLMDLLLTGTVRVKMQGK